VSDQAPRLPYERALEDLLAAYRQAQTTIAVQIRDAIATGQLARAHLRRSALAAIISELDDLGIRTDPQARQLLADAYQQSAEHTHQIIGASAGPVDDTTFAGISREAITALQDSTIASLTGARAQVGRRVADEFARAGRRATLQAVLGAQGSRREASADLVSRLQDRGIRAFTDRSGREWALDRYAAMAMRTTTREAVVEGAKARMVTQGVTVAEVSRHASPCRICAPWEGVLVSLDGLTDRLDGRAVATLGAMPNGGPPFHPNCRHTLMPVVASAALAARKAMVA
jgi:hypothetical protein